MGERTVFSVILGLLAMVLLAGCSSFDGQKVRREHAASYPQALAQTTAEALSAGDPLGLEDCCRIAMENSLQTRSAEIQQRIAKLERKVAFANFLPVVSVGYQHYEFDPSISLPLPDMDPVKIDKVRSIMWEANVSLFNPATWFLYAMHKRGEEIAGLVTDYTRQMTAWQVTALYFQCLSLEEAVGALDSELAAAVQMEKDLRALSEEGLVSEWQAEQAGVLVQARRIGRNQTQRSLAQARANLLAAMGLSPVADFSLKQQLPLEPPEGAVEELILEALLSHPRLAIADRSIEIEKEKVKIALSNFLPQLFGFVYRPDSLEDFVSAPDQWIYGMAGTMTLFTGFANINEYKAARQRRTESFLEREQASLAVMLSVIEAHLALETAKERVALARSALDVKGKELAETEEKWREGLVNSSEMLERTSERDRAQMQAINARFQYQVSTATLLNAMGRTKIDYKEPQNDGQS